MSECLLLVVNNCTLPVRGSSRIEVGQSVIIPESKVKYWLALERMGFVSISAAAAGTLEDFNPKTLGQLRDPHKIISVGNGKKKMADECQNKMADPIFNKSA